MIGWTAEDGEASRSGVGCGPEDFSRLLKNGLIMSKRLNYYVGLSEGLIQSDLPHVVTSWIKTLRLLDRVMTWLSWQIDLTVTKARSVASVEIKGIQKDERLKISKATRLQIELFYLAGAFYTPDERP
jgi:hypothetical protein